MTFTAGNQLWRARTKHGRDKLFASADALWEACVEYFEWVEANPLLEDKAFAYEGDVTHESMERMRPMTFGGLSVFIDIETETWRAWRSDPDFSAICSRVDRIIREQKFSGAAAGLLNPVIIARDLGLVDAKSLSGPDGGAIPIKSESRVTHAIDVESVVEGAKALKDAF